MLRPSSILFVLLVLLVLSVVIPARAQVLTLQDVERRVVAADATRSARAKITQMDAELDVARSGRRPVVTLNTEASASPGGRLIDVESVGGERFLVQGSRPLGEPGAFTIIPRYGGLLSAHADIFDFGRTASRIRAAEHRARATRAEEQALTSDLLRTTREAYLAWAVTHARLALAEQHEREGRARAETLRGLIAEGTRPAADRNAADQDEVALGIEVTDARAERDRALLRLEHLAGGPWPAAMLPDLGLLEIPTDRAPEEAPSLAAAALEQQAAAAAAMADSAAHDHAPLISAAAEAGVRGQSSEVFPAYRVAVTVTVPLWDGGTGSAHARAARAEAEALQAEAGASRKSRETEQRLARGDLQHAQEKLRLAARLRQLAQNELEQTNERYRLGAIDLRAILDVRERLSRAEAQELVAKAERASAWLRAQP